MFYIILKDYYELHIFRNEQVSELASMTPSKIGMCAQTPLWYLLRYVLYMLGKVHISVVHTEEESIQRLLHMLYHECCITHNCAKLAS